MDYKDYERNLKEAHDKLEPLLEADGWTPGGQPNCSWIAFEKGPLEISISCGYHTRGRLEFSATFVFPTTEPGRILQRIRPNELPPNDCNPITCDPARSAEAIYSSVKKRLIEKMMATLPVAQERARTNNEYWSALANVKARVCQALGIPEVEDSKMKNQGGLYRTLKIPGRYDMICVKRFNTDGAISFGDHTIAADIAIPMIEAGVRAMLTLEQTAASE